jgi:hypothetical protein
MRDIRQTCSTSAIHAPRSSNTHNIRRIRQTSPTSDKQAQLPPKQAQLPPKQAQLQLKKRNFHQNKRLVRQPCKISPKHTPQINQQATFGN